MKQLSFYASCVMCCLLCLTTSCKQQPSAVQQVAQGEPIMPILLQADTTQIVLTDYLPTLNIEESINISFGEQTFELLPTEDGKITIITPQTAKKELGRASYQSLSIPILPQMAHRNALYTAGAKENTITLVFTAPALNPTFQVYWQNTYLENATITKQENNEYLVSLPDFKSEGRSFLRIYTIDDKYLYNDILIPMQDGQIVFDAAQLNRHDQQAQVLYSLMIDRFFNGNPYNDSKLNDPEVLDIVDYYGGDIAGITEKICAGFFDDLGINTIWISPITQNPYDAWGLYEFQPLGDNKYNNKYDSTKAFTRFSGYHGYWPIYTTQIDQRFGTDEELHDLLEVAHEHNINVILDYVANHIHINSPVLKQHPDWITDSILPDGRRNFELWDEARLTTWFDRHIPTLDLEREEVYQPMTDSALYWLENFDLDGFRHDACKHIPEAYWRTLTSKMKNRFPNRSLWMIGETYGSPQLIGSYVKTGMLNAQFDFNVYFTIVNALADNGSMQEVSRVIEESLAAYGAHHTMGNISGNHDQTRFITLVGNELTPAERYHYNGKEVGWTREVGVGDTAIAYKKAILQEVLNLTIPGVPCIYQGDEYGQPGGNDPDNRHPMRFNGYNENETQMLQTVKELIQLRRNSMPLIYGDYLPIYADQNLLIFERTYMGQSVMVIINSGDTTRNFNIGDEQISIDAYGYKIL